MKSAVSVRFTAAAVLCTVLLSPLGFTRADDAEYLYYLPYYDSRGETWTGVALANEAVGKAAADITVFSQSGTSLETQTLELPHQGQQSAVIGKSLDTQGWIRIEADQPLSGLCFFGTSHSMADITLIPELSENLTVPHVAQTDEWDSDVRICNGSQEQARVILVVTDTQGAHVGTAQESIPPMGSLIVKLSSITSYLPSGKVDITSTRPVAAFALYNNLKTGHFCYAGVAAANTQNDANTSIDQRISSIMSRKKVPGISVAVVRNDRTAKMTSYGYANTTTLQPFTDRTCLMLASVSKVFTGIALMQLYEDGKFQLDDAINTYLPFQVHVPYYEDTLVTFRMLLTHTSSIVDGDALDSFYNWNGDPVIPLGECLREYLTESGKYYSEYGNFLDEQPGTAYEYSNIGAALEGYLVEVVSGVPFNEYCNTHIFEQAGMPKTKWFLSEYEASDLLANPHENLKPMPNYGFADYPNGQLHSNIYEMTRFMRLIFNNGSLDGRRILSESTLQQMLTPQIPSINPTQGLQFYKETFHTSSGTVRLWGHSGGEAGISTEMYFDFEARIGIIVLADSDADMTEVVEELYDYAVTEL